MHSHVVRVRIVLHGARCVLRRAVVGLLLACAAGPATSAAWARVPDVPQVQRTEVIIGLAPPPAARAGWQADSPERARGALLAIDRAQRLVERRILARVPGAAISWHYRLVLDGLAVSLPASQLARLTAIPGVTTVFPSVTYHALADDGPSQIGAPALWGADAPHAGAGIRIGVIDDGIDPRHPYFSARGFSAPSGFPKGNLAYTSAKVIVARAFAPPGAGWRYAGVPFDPVNSFHGMHVAGIAAGDAATLSPATDERPAISVSGVAPGAYLGNYKALTVPTPSGVGLDGNSPELVAAIEAAVADGMDVLNLSLGEPEISPDRDAVALALDNAARAGVVPVVAAGNSLAELGRGSVGSPGSSGLAITVGAVTGARYFGTAAHVSGSDPVPSDVATFGGVFSQPQLPAGLAHDVPIVDAAASADATLCTPPAPDAFAGAVVLARAGTCSLAQKTAAAESGGALAVVLAIAGAGDPTFVPRSAPPVLKVAKRVGADIAAYLARAGDSARVRFDPGAAEVASEEGGLAAGFSSAGPTPLSVRLKPDVSAPGVDILSAQPSSSFDLLSGTSMAAPHVAGAAALVRQRHPGWTPAEIKAALVFTGQAVWTDATHGREAAVPRQGGGVVALPAAVEPLLLPTPAELSLGLVDVSHGAIERSLAVNLADAGRGSGVWSVHVQPLENGQGALLDAPQTVTAPGELAVRLVVDAAAAEGERDGFVVLERDGVQRRIPYWFRVTRPQLGGERVRVLPGPGVYDGDTRRGVARVGSYRYPSGPSPARAALPGPEQVFRLTLRRPAANLGVAIVSHDPGVRVSPRIVAGADENRLLGPLALPIVANPYLSSFDARRPVVGVASPDRGAYSIVFDTPAGGLAGRFTFRVWIGDVTPPRVRLLSRRAVDGIVRARARDTGSGIDPDEIELTIDRRLPRTATLRPGGLVLLDVSGLRPGRHRLELRVSDRQESKNDENVARVLPNTRIVRTTIVVPGPERRSTGGGGRSAPG
jgi:subtilisin family serine protease